MAALLAAGIASCGRGGNGEKLGERVIPLGQPVPKGGGRYFLGEPYRVAGVWYRPHEDPYYNRIGRASWYGELFHGRRTANGEIYDMNRLSAAHPTLPLPCYARVTNLANGRTIVVRVNDRGPYARDRIIDLSRRAAEVLAFRGSGTASVRVQYLGRAPLNGDDSYERRYLASQGFMQVASKGKGSRILSLAEAETLPAENPENLAAPWKAVASPEATASIGGARLGWEASSKPAEPSAAAVPADPPTGALPKPTKSGGSVLIQAGSFKSRENADRARNVLGAIAPVDVSEVDVGGDAYFRVRVGPFADRPSAEAALGRVTQAGYRGARIVTK
jgi:rare lipoprotein A